MTSEINFKCQKHLNIPSEEVKKNIGTIALANIELLRENILPLNLINNSRNPYSLKIWFSETGNIKILKGRDCHPKWTSSDPKPSQFKTYSIETVNEMYGNYHARLTCLFFKTKASDKIEWNLNGEIQFTPTVNKVMNITKKLFLCSYYKVNIHIEKLIQGIDFSKKIMIGDKEENKVKISLKENYDLYKKYHKFTLADCIFFLPCEGAYFNLKKILKIE